MAAELWLTSDTPESLWPTDGSLAGLFTETRDPIALQAVYDRCAAHGIRPAVLFDGFTYQPPVVPVPPWGRILVEMYLIKGLALAQCAQKWYWDGVEAQKAGVQIGIAAMGYTQNLFTEQEVLNCQPHYADILNTSPQYAMISHFALGRGNAIPSLREVLHRFMKATPGHAELLPVNPQSSNLVPVLVVGGVL